MFPRKDNLLPETLKFFHGHILGSSIFRTPLKRVPIPVPISTYQKTNTSGVLDKDFEYFKAIHQHQISVCMCRNCIRDPKPGWSLKGLWHGNYFSDDSVYCNQGKIFNFKTIQSRNHQIRKAWVSLLDHNETTFYENNWEKHGRCSAHLLSQFKYFLFALDCYNQHGRKLDAYLKESNIEPDDSRLYSIEKFSEAIERKTKKAVGLRCKTSKSGVNTICEVCICYDKYLRTIIDCPSKETTCRGDFVYPRGEHK